MDNRNIKKHAGRDDLAGEHKYGDLGQIVLFIFFVTGSLVDLFLFDLFAQTREAIPSIFRIPVSIPFFIFSFLLFRSSHRAIFALKRDNPEVIQTGVYAIVRHPMYLGAILLYLAFLILSLSFISFIIWIMAIIFYLYISHYEELILLEKLGVGYEEYKRKVPMFVPRFKKGN